VTASNDHFDVGDVRHVEVDDAALMASARRLLRPLVPDAPPTASAALGVVLREGLPDPADAHSGLAAWAARMAGRVAGLGVAAKLMLAAGVAVAGVGSAATAVELTHDGHDTPHSRLPAPASPSPRSTDTDRHGATPPALPTSVPSGSHEGGSTHDGTSENIHDGDSHRGDTQSHDGSSGGDDGGSLSTSGRDGSGSGSDGGSDDGGTSSTTSGSTTTSGSHDGDSGSGSGSDGGSSTSGSGSDGGTDGGTDGGLASGSDGGGSSSDGGSSGSSTSGGDG